MTASDLWESALEKWDGRELFLKSREVFLVKVGFLAPALPEGYQVLAYVSQLASGVGQKVYLIADTRKPEWPMSYLFQGDAEFDPAPMLDGVDKLLANITVVAPGEPSPADQWAVFANEVPPAMHWDLEPQINGAVVQTADPSLAEKVRQYYEKRGIAATVERVAEWDRLITPFDDEW